MTRQKEAGEVSPEFRQEGLALLMFGVWKVAGKSGGGSVPFRKEIRLFPIDTALLWVLNNLGIKDFYLINNDSYCNADLKE